MDKTSYFLNPKAVLLIIIITLSVSLSSCGRSSELDPKVIERSKQLPLLEYNILSSEKTHPHPNKFGRYNEAIMSYPNVRDCLIESERDSERVDLRLIDWPQFSTSYEINLCLWRVFNSLNNVEGVTDWMEFHGLNVRGRVVTPKLLDGPRVTRYSLKGGYLIKRGKPLLSPYKQSVGLIKIPWAQKIITTWTEDKTKILSVFFQTTFE